MPMFFSDQEMHAYIDGALEPRRALKIAAGLAVQPARPHVPQRSAQRDALHALFDDVLIDDVLSQPNPMRLRAVLRRHRAGGSQHRIENGVAR